MKHGKKYRAIVQKFDLTKKYPLNDACTMVKDLKIAKFDETVEAHIALKLDKGATVRDTVVFPNQFKGEKKVLVFCQGDKIKEALDAGAAYAGSDEYIEKVKGGWLDFDIAVSTPDMMRSVGRLGMVLGRKGLMPNPKTGTVTNDVAGAISELKKGRTEYRADKAGVVHIAIGKSSMDAKKITENAETLINEVSKKAPNGVTQGFIRSICICSSMSPGIMVSYNTLEDKEAK